MKTTRMMLIATVGALLSGLALAPKASAQCSGYFHAAVKPSSWQPSALSGGARLLHASLVAGDQDDDDRDAREPIVGLWHVKLIAKNSPGIPDGTVVDAGYQAWHSDGTEILNSGARSPASGSFCLGVWKKIDYRTYKLNHFTISWDPTGAKFIGPGNIHEQVTVGPKGQHFSGTFSIDQYDTSGNPPMQVFGVVKGDRLDVDSPETSLF